MKSILCVDDDPTALSIQSIILKHAKFCDETITKANGLEAITYYDHLLATNETAYPEIIFLDLNMPVMDGWAFLEKFESQYYSKFPNTKVYILSSSVDPTDKLRSETFPFVKNFISKPITKDILAKIKNEEI
jgi:CheY-like chemotaxis protein